MYVAHLGGSSSTHSSHPCWPDSRRQWVGPAVPIFSWESASASPPLPGSPGPTREGQASTTGARHRPPPSPVEASLSLYRQHRLYPRVQGLLWRQRVGMGYRCFRRKGPSWDASTCLGEALSQGLCLPRYFSSIYWGAWRGALGGGQSSTSTTSLPAWADRATPLYLLSAFSVPLGLGGI